MAEVNYKATTSSDDQQIDEPSVEILDPKINSISVTFSDTLESKEPDQFIDLEYPNRPSSSQWKQQKLPAWQPILTLDTVLPAFFLLGVALVPIGVGLLISSNYVKEYSHEYTDCTLEDNRTRCSDIISFNTLNKSVKCQCWLHFRLDEDFNAPVFFYYGLSNFYQNHRRYVRSRDDRQLKGKVDENLSEDCQPFDKVGNQQIAPCGAIANSFFSDAFKLFWRTGNTLERIDLTQTDIAWPTDKEVKFENPPEEIRYKYPQTKPPYWKSGVFDLDFNHPDNNGYRNEHLIVWMRTAALPTFRKLWARIDHDQNILWRSKLPRGNYSILIDYKYPVKNKEWRGGKYIFISNTSWLGGKNSFLGYAYIVVGAICLILWLVFLIIVKKFGQNPKDIVDIGPKTSFVFTPSKPKDSTDDSRQPLRSTIP